MDWLENSSPETMGFSGEIWVFPVVFPLNQSIDCVCLNMYENVAYDLSFWSNQKNADVRA